MTDVARCLREGFSLPPNAVAVTVDDGNRDFLINGFPVFQAYNIPVTVYLVSGFLDQKLWLWWDKIIYLMEQTRQPSFKMALALGEAPAEFVLKTRDQRGNAILAITEAMKKT